MRAVVRTEYGPPEVLRIADVEKPALREGEVLVDVRAASVNPLDWHYMRGTPYLVRAVTGLRRPKSALFGVDVAGRVEAVGEGVKRFRPGDEVFGACDGAFAEFARASEGALASKPAHVAFEQAAAAPVAALTALQALRDKGRVEPGQRVLVNGASGGVGTFAVQIARSFGAEVTGVCSTRNVEMVRSIGADHVIDYTREDFTRAGRRYDVILDIAGNHPPSACRRALTRRGTLVMVGGPDNGNWVGPLLGLLEPVVVSMFVSQKLAPFLAHRSQEDLTTIGELLGTGTVTPVIDRAYPLHEVPEAIRHLERGHARGKVVIAG